LLDIKKKKDVRGDQYPGLPFRESPVGERGLESDGEIPSASDLEFEIRGGHRSRRGIIAVREPARPLPRTNKTASTR